MSDPAVNTKIERLTEAIEGLTLAVAVSVMDKTRPAKNFEQVKDARDETYTALKEFLQPLLHVVSILVLLWPAIPDARPLYPGAWDKVADTTSDFLSHQRRPTMRPWTGDWHHDSCCGPADAYETDIFESEEGELWATITEGDLVQQPYCNGPDDMTGEDNEDHSKCKTRIVAGTRIHVPRDRIIEIDPNYPNLTGHGWIWLASGHDVFCYAYPSAF